MNRRAFLRTGGLATMGLVVGADALEAMARLTHRRTLFAGWSPTLHGDGVHDDTAALRALFNGRPYHDATKGRLHVRHDGAFVLTGGTYRITDTVAIEPAPRPRGSATMCVFRGDDLPTGHPMLHLLASPTQPNLGLRMCGNATSIAHTKSRLFDPLPRGPDA